MSAVIALLGESGYEAMTMDAVAARAHASKADIVLPLLTGSIAAPGPAR